MTVQQQILMADAASPGPSTSWAVPSYSLIDGNTVALISRLGWSFTVTGGDMLVSRLRVILADSLANPENVRIHRNSDNALMTQADITPSFQNYVEAGISPITLADGAAYTISSRNSATRSVRRNNTVTFSPRVTVISTGLFGSDDNRPTSVTSNTYLFCDFGFV